MGPNQNKMLLENKRTSDGRWHQNIKSGISQQPLMGSSSNLKLKLREPNKNKVGLKWRHFPMDATSKY
jgi:hypothetical protein